MKSLTIAIPTYKSEYSLGRLLDSILDSPDSAKLVSEILISDNDPNSKLGLLIERKYQHESEIAIRYLKNDKNLGYDGNLYQLSQECKTKLIKFIADDDLLTDEFFLSLKYIVELGIDLDIILHNFRTIPETTRTVIKSEDVMNRFQVIGPEWTYDQIQSLLQIYGQISTLTFNNHLLRNLRKPAESNYIHIFWFFSVLESSKVLVDWGATIIVSLGSPNFSQNLLRQIAVPRGGVLALEETEMLNPMIKTRLISDTQLYCLGLLRAAHRLKLSQKVELFRIYRKDLFQNPVWFVRLLPRFVAPRMLTKLLKGIARRA